MSDDAASGERWLPVSGYEGMYEVSDQGRVRSCPRFVVYTDGRRRTFPGVVMRPQTATNGYYQVRLTRERIARNWGIHVMVCTAFHGARPWDTAEVRHLNGDRKDSQAANITWGTRTENAQDRIRHGTSRRALKDRCRWGHLFAGANLLESCPRGGDVQRSCRSCHGASQMARYWQKKGVPFDRRADADRRYAVLGLEPPRVAA